MRAVLCRQFGSPDLLTVDECEVPQPGPGHVRVKVRAAGVNFPDMLMVEGKYQLKPDLPFSPGSEFSGIVEAVGDGVVGFDPGMAVLGTVPFGAFAEQAVVPAATLMRLPASTDPLTGSVFATAYGTGIHALKQRANLRPGETLLVLGAGGGVGRAAVEIGKAMGATVIAAASTPEKLEIARAAGADHLINYAETSLKEQVKELTRGKGVDVACDPVGGELLEEALRATGWAGRVLTIGFTSGTIPRIPANIVLLKANALVGVHYGPFQKNFPELNRQNFAQLFAWHQEGKLKPLISRTFALSDAGEALRLLADRKVMGKIVIDLEGKA